MPSSLYPKVITARISDIGGKKGTRLELSIKREESYLLPKGKSDVSIIVQAKTYQAKINHGSSPTAKWYFTSPWTHAEQKHKMSDVLLKTGLMNEEVQLKVLSSTEFELLS